MEGSRGEFTQPPTNPEGGKVLLEEHRRWDGTQNSNKQSPHKIQQDTVAYKQELDNKLFLLLHFFVYL